MRIDYNDFKETIEQALINAGLTLEQADLVAQIHSSTALDGIYSHGLNRIPVFIKAVKNGWVNLNGKLELRKAFGVAENYDGNRGIGVINAMHASQRAVELAKIHGVGLVSVRNTSHWMRGGTYAWEIANSGMIGMCWSNTESAVTAWGSIEPCVGLNPVCFSVPRDDGALVLDMALSQYSYGKLQTTRLAGETLPFPGGYNKNGELTVIPAEIEETKRALPIGFWKGSGLALALDIIGAVLANGLNTPALDLEVKGKMSSAGSSQIFIAINPEMFSTHEEVEDIANRSIDAIHNATPINPDEPIVYPGERQVKRRKENIEKGIPVDEGIWNDVCKLAGK